MRSDYSLSDCVYVLIEYVFYDAEHILMITSDYDKAKEKFNQLVENSKTGKGYTIEKYSLDKYYKDNPQYYPESIDWIIVEYNGRVKNMMEL